MKRTFTFKEFSKHLIDCSFMTTDGVGVQRYRAADNHFITLDDTRVLTSYIVIIDTDYITIDLQYNSYPKDISIHQERDWGLYKVERIV